MFHHLSLGLGGAASDTCLGSEIECRFRQLLAIASQVDDNIQHKNWFGNRFGFPRCILLDKDPGIDQPVLHEPIRAGEVCIALPLVIVGAFLLAAIELHARELQFGLGSLESEQIPGQQIFPIHPGDVVQVDQGNDLLNSALRHITAVRSLKVSKVKNS